MLKHVNNVSQDKMKCNYQFLVFPYWIQLNKTKDHWGHVRQVEITAYKCMHAQIWARFLEVQYHIFCYWAAYPFILSEYNLVDTIQDSTISPLAHQQVNGVSHEMQLIIHGLFLVVVGEYIGEGWQPCGAAGEHTLPQTAIEETGLRHHTELLHQLIGPGERKKNALFELFQIISHEFGPVTDNQHH